VADYWVRSGEEDEILNQDEIDAILGSNGA